MTKKTKLRTKLPAQLKFFKKPPAILLIITMAVVGIVFLVASKAATGSATVSISPSSGSRVKDSTFPLSIYVDSKAADINAFTLKLSYDQSKLQPTAATVNVGDSQFTGCAEKSTGGGVIKLTCFVTGEVINTRQTVGTLTFKVISGTGSSALTLGDDTQISQAGSGVNLWDGNKAMGSFSFTNPVTPTPTTPTPTPTPTPSTSKPTTNGGGGSSTPKTSTPSTSTPKTSASSNPTNSAAIPTVSPDPSSNQPQITGIVAVAITGENGQPAVGVKVKIGKLEAVTDSSGVASFIGLAPGKYKLSASSSVLGAATKEITIGEAANVAQEFKLQLKKRPNFLLYGLVALLLALVIIAIVKIRRWLRERAEASRRFSGLRGGNVSNTPATPVNDSVATVVTPKADTADEEKEALEKIKPKVESTDTLEEIEKKVGAKKGAAAQADAAEFTPNLILPKKEKPTKLDD